MDRIKELIIEEFNTYYGPNRHRLRRQSSRHVLTDSAVLKKAEEHQDEEEGKDDPMQVDQELERALAGGL